MKDDKKPISFNNWLKFIRTEVYKFNPSFFVDLFKSGDDESENNVRNYRALEKNGKSIKFDWLTPILETMIGFDCEQQCNFYREARQLGLIIASQDKNKNYSEYVAFCNKYSTEYMAILKEYSTVEEYDYAYHNNRMLATFSLNNFYAISFLYYKEKVSPKILFDGYYSEDPMATLNAIYFTGIRSMIEQLEEFYRKFDLLTDEAVSYFDKMYEKIQDKRQKIGVTPELNPAKIEEVSIKNAKIKKAQQEFKMIYRLSHLHLDQFDATKRSINEIVQQKDNFDLNSPEARNVFIDLLRQMAEKISNQTIDLQSTSPFNLNKIIYNIERMRLYELQINTE